MKCLSTAAFALILSSIFISSCTAAPTPIFEWFRRFVKRQKGNNVTDISQYGEFSIYINSGYRNGKSIVVPTTGIRDPSPALLSRRLRSAGGKILEATLQFEDGQQYVRLSSVTMITVGDRIVSGAFPFKCKFFVGDASAAGSDGEEYQTVGESLVLGTPRVIGRSVDGIRCVGLVEGKGTGRSDDDVLNEEIDVLLDRYLTGVPSEA